MGVITAISFFQQHTILQIVWICVIYTVLVVLYKTCVAPYRHLKKLGLQVPMPKPIIGNLMDYGRHQHIGQVKRQEQYGNIYGTLFLNIPTQWIGDPEIIKTIMIKEFSNFANKFPIAQFAPPLDRALGNLRDDDWKRVRNILIPTFSAAKLKMIIPDVISSSDGLVNDLIKADNEGKAIDIPKACNNFSMQTIFSTAYGIEVKSQEQKDTLMSSIEGIFNFKPHELVLLSYFPSLLTRFKLLGGTHTASVQYVANAIENVLKQRRKNLEQGIPCRRDILQTMIEAGEYDKLNDEEIISQAFILLTAGYESTATVLAFSFYTLATNPHIQQKLIDEIDSKCPNANSISYNIVNDLTYLDMFLSEMLRMFPPFIFTIREIRQDVTINSVRFSKDAMLAVPIYGIHHNSEIWPNPEHFIPERFTPEEKAKHHPCSYMPFGIGPRNCIGMKLGLLEAKIVIIKVLQNIELVVVPETQIPLKIITKGTLSTENGIYVGIRKRN